MKIGFLIIARLKSTRLPYKVMQDLGGRTVIQRIIDRAKCIEGLSNIVLCTSNNPQDKVLVDVAKKEDIHYYMGSEDDVIRRLRDCTRFYGLDYMIGITGDNPLFSIYYSKLIFNEINKNTYDYIKVDGLPLGCGTYGIKAEAIDVICRVKNVVKTEIWGELVDRPEIFNIKTIRAKDGVNRPDLRLTMDYIEDYNVFRNIYNNFKEDEVVNLYDAIEFLEEHPEIRDLNKACTQAYLSNSEIARIRKHFAEDIDSIREIKDMVYK